MLQWISSLVICSSSDSKYGGRPTVLLRADVHICVLGRAIFQVDSPGFRKSTMLIESSQPLKNTDGF